MRRLGSNQVDVSQSASSARDGENMASAVNTTSVMIHQQVPYAGHCEHNDGSTRLLYIASLRS